MLFPGAMGQFGVYRRPVPLRRKPGHYEVPAQQYRRRLRLSSFGLEAGKIAVGVVEPFELGGKPVPQGGQRIYVGTVFSRQRP